MPRWTSRYLPWPIRRRAVFCRTWRLTSELMKGSVCENFIAVNRLFIIVLR